MRHKRLRIWIDTNAKTKIADVDFIFLPIFRKKGLLAVALRHFTVYSAVILFVFRFGLTFLSVSAALRGIPFVSSNGLSGAPPPTLRIILFKSSRFCFQIGRRGTDPGQVPRVGNLDSLMNAQREVPALSFPGKKIRDPEPKRKAA